LLNYKNVSHLNADNPDLYITSTNSEIEKVKEISKKKKDSLKELKQLKRMKGLKI
jgi:hypothetical protein